MVVALLTTVELVDTVAKAVLIPKPVSRPVSIKPIANCLVRSFIAQLTRFWLSDVTDLEAVNRGRAVKSADRKKTRSTSLSSKTLLKSHRWTASGSHMWLALSKYQRESSNGNEDRHHDDGGRRCPAMYSRSSSISCIRRRTCAFARLGGAYGIEPVGPGRRRADPPRLELARRSRLDRGGDRSGTVATMTSEEIADLVLLRQARDRIDRDYADPLDVPAMARTALMSPAHFSRRFRAAYGETPYSYLMTRRIERAKALLRQGRSVTDACVTVGCTSLGSFSSRFTEIVGVSPSQYRQLDHRDLEVVPACVSMFATRPRRTAATA